jgi:hypothetical protein
MICLITSLPKFRDIYRLHNPYLKCSGPEMLWVSEFSRFWNTDYQLSIPNLKSKMLQNLKLFQLGSFVLFKIP